MKLNALEKVAFARMLGKGMQGVGRALGRPAGGKMIVQAQPQMAGSAAHAAAARSAALRNSAGAVTAANPAPAVGQMGRGVAGMTNRGAPLLGRVGGLLTPRNLMGAGAVGAAGAGLYAAHRFAKGTGAGSGSVFDQRNQDMNMIEEMGQPRRQ